MIANTDLGQQKSAGASHWLLDGSIYFFRGYFGMPDTLVDDQGEPCGGIHGFAKALAEVLKRHSGRQGAVAFDKSLGSCFRNDLYPAYKANRPLPDENIIYQFEQCTRLCELLGVPVYASKRYEADDILATLAARSRKMVTIYSKDKDLRQIVNKKCILQDISGGDRFDADSFLQVYDFEPALFPDYQALVGDASDNVPGVPGFGPKTAGKLVARYGALEQIYQSVEHWSADKVGVPSNGKLALNLADHGEHALEMREILRLQRKVPLPLGAMNRGKVQEAELVEFFAAKKLRRLASVLRDFK